MNFQNLKSVLFVLVLSAVAFTSSMSKAEVVAMTNTKIIRTLTDTYYGGCAVQLDRPIAARDDGKLAGCANSWVSLDCDALHHTQAQANAMWSSALVGFSLQRTVHVFIDDSIQFNGLCMARRLDITNQP